MLGVGALAVLLLADPAARQPVGTLLVIVGSVLWHELGHAWVARRRGRAVTGIYLHVLPFAYVERGGARDAWRIALAGPLASLALAGLTALVPAARRGFELATPSAWFLDPLHTALGLNLLMAGLNLLPALPLDGGHALRAAIAHRYGEVPAGRALHVAGLSLGAGCCGAAYALYAERPAEAVALGLLGAVVVLRTFLRQPVVSR